MYFLARLLPLRSFPSSCPQSYNRIISSASCLLSSSSFHSLSAPRTTPAARQFKYSHLYQYRLCTPFHCSFRHLHTRSINFSNNQTRAVHDGDVLLGVETSCDETALALMDVKHGTVLASLSSSQWEQYNLYGGVKPEAAAMEHQRKIQNMFESLLSSGKVSRSSIRCVCVTIGPGLAPCLQVGLEWSRSLSSNLNIPILGVHHMLAHVIVTQLQLKDMSPPKQLQFPFLALLVSGGHTELWLCESLNKHSILCRTVDEAVGEALDKAARLLALKRNENESPGAALERHANMYREDDSSLPKFTLPQLKSTHIDFSFAGCKSALQKLVFALHELGKRTKEANGKGKSEGNDQSLDVSTLDASSLPNIDSSTMKLLTKQFKKTVMDSNQLENNSTVDVSSSDSQSSSSSSSSSSHFPSLPLPLQISICHTFQSTLFTQIIQRVQLGVRFVKNKFQNKKTPTPPLTTLVLAGGVACNRTLASSLSTALSPMGISVLACAPQFCTDNAVMIAWLGRMYYLAGYDDVREELNFVTKWPIGRKICMEQYAQMERDKKKKINANHYLNKEKRKG